MQHFTDLLKDFLYSSDADMEGQVEEFVACLKKYGLKRSNQGSNAFWEYALDGRMSSCDQWNIHNKYIIGTGEDGSFLVAYKDSEKTLLGPVTDEANELIKQQIIKLKLREDVDES